MDYMIYSLEVVVLLYLVYGFNVILHSIGIFLMIKVRKPGGRKNQDLCIINLAIGDLLKNVVSIVALVTYTRLSADFSHAVWLEVWKVAVSMNAFGLYLWQYIAIIFVTLDRLLTVLYSSYTHIWTKKKTKILIATCWVLEVMGCGAPYLAHKLDGFNNNRMLDIYIKTTLDVIFMVLSVSSYSAMFRKFVRSHRRTVRMQQNSVVQQNARQPQTAWQLFRKSRFVLAVILITSFLLCVAIPDIVLSVLIFSGQTVPDILLKVFLFLSAISDTIDGLIYVFVRADIRDILCEMLKFSRNRRSSGISLSTVSTIWKRRRRIESHSTRTKE